MKKLIREEFNVQDTCEYFINKQVKEEDRCLLKEKYKYFDKCLDAINQLKPLMTYSQYLAICKKLNEEVRKTVEQYL